MLRLPVKKLRPGLITARNIYNAKGRMLLSYDIVLDERLIQRLADMGIDSVYVANPYFKEEPQEILHEKTRVETIKVTQKAFTTFRISKVINIDDLKNVAKMIIEDVMNNKHVMIHLTDIRTYDDYTFGHSIDTCLIASVIGLKLGLKEKKLNELALGVLFHDIGKMLIPSEILNKTDPLSTEEWQIIKDHAKVGFDILRKESEIPLASAHIAYQHHENFDGSGYPRGISSEDIHLYARVAAVADLYDAITSDRPYRPAMLPHEAYEVVLGSRGNKLDPKVTDIFLDYIVLFPVGTMVLLNTGDIGVVTKVYPKLQTRPVIQLVFDKSGQKIAAKDKFMDLTVELIIFIVKVFKPEEVANWGT